MQGLLYFCAVILSIMDIPLLFFNLGGSEIMLILLVVLLLFGSNKIPELARGLGKGIREFKDATNGIKREIEKGMEETKEVIEKDTKPAAPKPYAPPQSVARVDDDEPATTDESTESNTTNTETKATEPGKEIKPE